MTIQLVRKKKKLCKLLAVNYTAIDKKISYITYISGLSFYDMIHKTGLVDCLIQDYQHPDG